MDRDNNDPPPSGNTIATSYEDDIQEAQERLSKFVFYISVANLMGLLGGISVWRLFPENEEVQDIMVTAAMIFAIGLATALGSYAIFRSSMVISREAGAIALDAGEDEAGLSVARERQGEAFARIQSGMRTLKIAGICFVASTMIGITGLFSV